MNAVKSVLIKFMLLLALFVLGNQALQAQESNKDKEQQKAAAVKNMVDTKNFVFKAQSMTPMRGRNRQLTSEYDLKIFNDSLISFLPYFGRAYTAPVNPSEGGLQFTSTDFQYQATARKKGGWEITIQPKDHRDVRQLLLNVFESGNATLQVISNNRDPIFFNGYVAERPQKM